MIEKALDFPAVPHQIFLHLKTKSGYAHMPNWWLKPLEETEQTLRANLVVQLDDSILYT